MPKAFSDIANGEMLGTFHGCGNGIDRGMSSFMSFESRQMHSIMFFFGRTSIDDSHAVRSSTFAITSHYMSLCKVVLTFSQIAYGTFLGACFSGAFSPLRRVWYFPVTRPSSALITSAYISTSFFLGSVLHLSIKLFSSEMVYTSGFASLSVTRIHLRPSLTL